MAESSGPKKPTAKKAPVKKQTAKKTTAKKTTGKNHGHDRRRRSRPPAGPIRPSMLTSFNPRTGATVGEVAANSPADVADAIALARKVAPEWAAISPAGRAHLLKDVRHAIYEHLDDIVEAVATETGKPRTEALFADVMPAVMTLMYYERTAAKHLRSNAWDRSSGRSQGCPARSSGSRSASSGASPRGTTRSSCRSWRSWRPCSRATSSSSSRPRSPHRPAR